MHSRRTTGSALQWLVIVSAIASGCSERAHPELHLIPEGFMGEVAIIYSVANGAPPVVEGKFRVFQIPASGVLHTQEPIGTGRWMRDEKQYHYVDQQGERTRIWGRGGGLADTPKNRAYEGAMAIEQRRGTGRTGSCTFQYSQYAVGTAEFLLSRKRRLDVRAYIDQHPELCIDQER